MNLMFIIFNIVLLFIVTLRTNVYKYIQLLECKKKKNRKMRIVNTRSNTAYVEYAEKLVVVVVVKISVANKNVQIKNEFQKVF